MGCVCACTLTRVAQCSEILPISLCVSLLQLEVELEALDPSWLLWDRFSHGSSFFTGVD